MFDKSEKYDVRYDYEINASNRLFARAVAGAVLDVLPDAFLCTQ